MNEVITSTFIVQSPKIDDVRNVVKDYIKNHHYRFIQINIKCSRELCFSDNSTRSPISNITSFSNRNINITTNKLFRWFYNSICSVRKQGLELISIRELKIVFKSYFYNITFKHYLEKPKPMIETILKKQMYKNPELIEVLAQIHRPRSYLIPLFLRFYLCEEQTNHQ